MASVRIPPNRSVEPELRLEIDELRLDREWLSHPQQYYRWRQIKSDADRALSEAKAARDVAKADLASEIRSSPDAYGLVKSTVDSVNEAVDKHPVYRKKLEAVIEAQYRADIAANAVAALTERKHALQGLVELLTIDYWSAPRANRNTSDEVGDIEERAGRPRGIRPDPADREE